MAEFKDARTVWDRRFSAAHGLLFGEAPNQWLATQQSWIAPDGKVLCVADGEARNGVFLAGNGRRVTSFDVSPVAVDKARALAAERGVTLELAVCGIDDWAFEADAYDAVVAIYVQFATPAQRTRMFDGFRRTLKPGGVLVIEGYGLRQLRYRTGGPGIAENLYTSAMLAAAFPGWEILSSRDADVDLQEGTAHVGLSHVVSAVFRRPATGAPVVRG